MDQSFIPLSEKTANDLCEALQNCSYSMKSLANSFGQASKNLAVNKVTIDITKYQVKDCMSNILIRWYWKRKLRRAEIRLSNLENIIANER